MDVLNIPYYPIATINHHYKAEILAAVNEIIKKGNFILGNAVQQFEHDFATYLNCNYCCTVGNGLNALEIILRAFNFNAGDEIIVPSNTFYATALAVINCNLKPVLVEPNLSDFNIDTTKIEAKITKKTKAIIAVHLYGRIANMNVIWQIAQKYQLKVIEDAAQAHGAQYYNKKAGNLSDAAAFSFYPTKNLACYGDGGAITTNSINIYEKILKIRNYGFSKKNKASLIGTNSRLDEIQAAILQVKLKYLDEENNKRNEIANYYNQNIKNDKIIKPMISHHKEHVWHIYNILSDERDALKLYLSQHGIETAIHYPIAIAKQEATCSFFKEHYPLAEKISHTTLSLPIYPILNIENLKYIVNVINKF